MGLHPPLDLPAWGHPDRAIAFQIMNLFGIAPLPLNTAHFDNAIDTTGLLYQRELSTSDATTLLLLELLEGKLITTLMREDVLGPDGYELSRQDIQRWLGEEALHWFNRRVFTNMQKRARSTDIIDDKFTRQQKAPELEDLRSLLDEGYVVVVERGRIHPRTGPSTYSEVAFFDSALGTERGVVEIYRPQSQPTLTTEALERFWQRPHPVVALVGYRPR